MMSEESKVLSREQWRRMMRAFAAAHALGRDIEQTVLFGSLTRHDAALPAEIERLRKALLKIRDGSLGGPANSSGWGRCIDIADKALHGGEED